MRIDSLTIKYVTGELDIASGADAAQIMAWWQSCEMFACQHGATYAGPKLRRVDCITQVDSEPVLAISETSVV
jgi:hypothetical protein